MASQNERGPRDRRGCHGEQFGPVITGKQGDGGCERGELGNNRVGRSARYPIILVGPPLVCLYNYPWPSFDGAPMGPWFQSVGPFVISFVPCSAIMPISLPNAPRMHSCCMCPVLTVMPSASRYSSPRAFSSRSPVPFAEDPSRPSRPAHSSTLVRSLARSPSSSACSTISQD